MFLTGVSTRTLSMMSERLTGRKVSPAEVSNAGKEPIAAVEKWITHDLSGETIKHIFLDGVNFDMCIDRRIEMVPVPVAIGDAKTGRKRVLGFRAGDKESAPTCREFFKDLKNRGLDGRDMVLVAMDGLPGLEKVFKEESPKAKAQRCQVHVSRNLLAKVPKKLKKAVGDDMQSIFYASSKPKAMEFFEIFKQRWQQDLPSAIKCLENSIEACLTLFICP